jgi:hypothetical protein
MFVVKQVEKPLASEQDDGAVCEVCERMQVDGTEPCSPRCWQGRGWTACRRRQTMRWALRYVARDSLRRSVYRWVCHDDEQWPGQAPHMQGKDRTWDQRGSATECGEECGKASSVERTGHMLPNEPRPHWSGERGCAFPGSPASPSRSTPGLCRLLAVNRSMPLSPSTSLVDLRSP